MTKQAVRGGRSTAHLYSNLSDRSEWVVNATPWPLYRWGRYPLCIMWETGWSLGQVCVSLENIAPTRVWAPDSTDPSESIYRPLSQLPPLGVIYRLLLFLQCSYVEINSNFDGLVIWFVVYWSEDVELLHTVLFKHRSSLFSTLFNMLSPLTIFCDFLCTFLDSLFFWWSFRRKINDVVNASIFWWEVELVSLGVICVGTWMNSMYDYKISLSSLTSRTPAGLCYSPIMVLTHSKTVDWLS
jgi:hypothetical protein